MPQIIDQTPLARQYVIHLDTSGPHKEYNSCIGMRDGKHWRALGPQSAPLGNSTNTPAAGVLDTTPDNGKSFYRRKRYDLLEGAKKFSPMGHRVKQCSCHPGKDRSGEARDSVSICLEDGEAKWKGLSHCGSVWSCPVCSARIQAERSGEVLWAMKQHRENGGVGILITYTYRHKRHDQLLAGINGFREALRKMKHGRAYKKLPGKYGQSGWIKAQEITYGLNGWHPHTHEIWFLDESITQEEAKELESELFDLWFNACKDAGVGLPTKAHGVRVDARDSDDKAQDAVGSYVTKWAAELTGNVNKKSKQSGRTPWQILESLCKKWTYKDDVLWKEYCTVMKGRKMLEWSRGLKDRFGVKEHQAEEKAARADQVVSDSLEVPKAKFYSIVKAKKMAEVLEVMESRGSAGASEYIDMIHKIITDEAKRNDVDKSRLRRQVRESTEQHMRDIGMVN